MTPRKKVQKRKLLVIPEASKACLSPETAHHVYEAVQKNKPVAPFVTNQSMSLHSEETTNENPYTAVMTGDLHVYGNADPFKKLNFAGLFCPQKCVIKWILLKVPLPVKKIVDYIRDLKD